jgi:hydrogenase nickel incorporation protein HypA/HybF
MGTKKGEVVSNLPTLGVINTTPDLFHSSPEKYYKVDLDQMQYRIENGYKQVGHRCPSSGSADLQTGSSLCLYPLIAYTNRTHYLAMHEFALAEDLLKLALNEARKADIVRLDKIIVQIGTLSGVSVDALEFSFGFLREEDPITKNAELVVKRVEGKGRCKTCSEEVALDRLFLFCPICNTPTIEITSGREFLLLSLEGETEDEPDKSEVANSCSDGSKPESKDG